MANIAFRNSGTGNNGSGATKVTVNVPSGVQNGDIMIASITIKAGTGTTITQGSWTALGAQLASPDTTVSQKIFWRVASSEPGSYDFTLSVSHAGSGIITAFSLGSSLLPNSNNYGGQGTNGSLTITTPSLTFTSTGGDGVALFCGGMGFGGNTTAAPTSFTEAANASSVAGASGTTTEHAYFIQTAQTSQSSTTETWTGTSASNVGHMVYLNAANQPRTCTDAPTTSEIETTYAYVRSFKTSNNGAGATTLTATVPSGVVNGDLMLLMACTYFGASPTAINVPSGWTDLASRVTTLAAGRIFYRVASSEPASYSVSWDGVSRISGCIMVAIAKGSSLAPYLSVSAGQNWRFVSPPQTYDIATFVAAGGLIIFGSMQAGSGTVGVITQPSGYAEITNLTTQSTITLEMAFNSSAGLITSVTGVTGSNTGSGDVESILLFVPTGRQDRTVTDAPTTSESAKPDPSTYLRTTTDHPQTSEQINLGITRFATESLSFLYEQISRVFVGFRAPTDAPQTSEIIVRGLLNLRTTTDNPRTPAAGEIVTRSFQGFRATTETPNTLDVITRGWSTSVTDHPQTSESVTKAAQVHFTTTDAPHTAEVASRVFVGLRTITDNPNTAEVATFHFTGFRTPTDAPTTMEVATFAFTGARTATDHPLTSEVASRAINQPRTTTDSPATADVATEAGGQPRSATDAPSTSEFVQKGGTLHYTATDAPTTAESVVRTLGEVRSANDAPATAEASSRMIINLRSTTESPSTAEAASITQGLHKTTTDAPTTSEVAKYNLGTLRTTLDNPATAEVASRVFSGHRTSSEAVSTSESAVVTFIRVVSAVDHPQTSEAITQHLGSNRMVADAPTTSEVVTRLFIGARVITEAVSTADTVIILIMRVPSVATIHWSVTQPELEWDASQPLLKWDASQPDVNWSPQ